MRVPHILLALLILVALGSQLYVQLEYDYAGAPEDVRHALIVGGVAMLVLAILGLPILLRGRVRLVE